jgi:lipopolysaccharide transport system ATP-binding protein
MYVRLAFAVAAHLEPEILIIDEVLAVGDAAFQQKCIGKIQDVARTEGRTVLFVSHNLTAIRLLCSRTIVLDQGRVAYDGAVSAGLALYSRRGDSGAPATYRHIAGDGHAKITRVSFASVPNGQAAVSIFEPAEVRLDYEARPDVGRMEGFVLIYSEEGECLVATFQRDASPALTPARPAGRLVARFDTPLAPGRYLISAGLFDGSRQFLDWVEFAERFEVIEGFADGRAFDQRLGRFNVTARWEESAR